MIDDGLSFTSYFYDGDGDSYGSGTAARDCSSPGAQWVLAGGDCDDAAGGAYPGAPEDCDGADDDCNGVPDDGIPFIEYFTDGDGDGFGTGYSTRVCEDPGSGWAEAGGDCADDSTARYPGATEICDALDNDCDTQVNEDLICP